MYSYREDQRDNVLSANGPAVVPGRPIEYNDDAAVAPSAGNVVLSKPGVGAYTLALSAVDGTLLNVTSSTAHAHVLTATGLLNDGVTGGAKDAVTFAAFPGASIQLMSWQRAWYVLGKLNASVA